MCNAAASSSNPLGRVTTLVLLVLVCWACLSASAQANAPNWLNFQGLLTDEVGEPIDGTPTIVVGIYDLPTGGVLLYEEIHTDVPVDMGLFTVRIGGGVLTGGGVFGVVSEAMFTEADRYIDVTIDGETLEPRQPLGSVAYALRTQSAVAAESATIAADANALDGLPSDAYQQRVNGKCAVGEAIGVVNANGSVECNRDIDTTYRAGSGLRLVGTTFSVEPAMVQSRIFDKCAAGEFMRAVAEDGSVACSPDADTDSNAATLCASGRLLNGSGACVVPSAHEHFGQTWTGSAPSPGVSVVNNAVALGSIGLHAGLANTPAHGYLGVEGVNGFGGIPFLLIGGREIGVLGTANDTGPGDNFALYGFSNGVGIHAEGGILAGEFVGGVEVEGDLTAERVAIGTTSFDHELVVQGDDAVLQIRDSVGNNSAGAARIELLERAGLTFDGGAYMRWDGAVNKLHIGTKNSSIDTDHLVVQRLTGNVGIGTDSPGSFKLAVNGIVGASEFVVAAGLSDYVLEAGYPLRPLEAVESFIAENGHLPEVPSAADAARDGVRLGEMGSTLLKKIEELTLYVIALNERVEELETENASLRSQRR